MIALIFLPVFIAAGKLELFLRDGVGGGAPIDLLGEFLATYFVMAIPLTASSVIYSIGLRFMPSAWSEKRKRIGAIVLAFMVPGGLLVFQLPIGFFFLVVPVSTTIAVIAYGACARVW